jgi:tetraacyldisaccharide-1-P 4'-kinase
MLTNADVVPPHQLIGIEERLTRCSAAPVLRAGRRATELRRITDGATDLLPIDVIALSAVGDNESFIKTLEQNGMRIVHRCAFRDHHWFDPDNIRTLLAGTDPGLPVITTTKDAVRLGAILPALDPAVAARFYALETEIYVNGEPLWEEHIRKAVPSFLTGTEH